MTHYEAIRFRTLSINPQFSHRSGCQLEINTSGADESKTIK